MILPTITTITPDWRNKVKEVEELGLREVNVFLTCLNREKRGELYGLLKSAEISKIPFVHIRSDMEPSELDLLVREFGTEVFNTHTQREFPLSFNLEKYKDVIYIENTYKPLDEEEIGQFAGICLDLSHLDNDRRFREDVYEHNIRIIEKHPCGCNHISPQKPFPLLGEKDWGAEPDHPHFMENLLELDYLKNYPERYFSSRIAIEMENSIKEQMKAIEYIKSILPHVR